MLNSDSIGKSAILIVNGGQDPEAGKWIELCVNKIIENTEWESYHIFIWNNNVEDTWVTSFLEKIPAVTLVQANPQESLAHPHAVPLHRLYEIARGKGFEYIVTMDSDAHPIKKDWLKELISSLNQQVVIAGVWRDELKKAIDPYIHASCLCTTVSFIEANNLRLDYIAPNTDTKIHDTLSDFTEKTKELGLNFFPLQRSNKNNFHRLMGGIYGNSIYHHGAGSRVGISFWDEQKAKSLMEKYKKMREEAATLLFRDYDRYIKWLQGEVVDESISQKMRQISEIEVLPENFDEGSASKNSHLKSKYSDRVENLIGIAKAALRHPKLKVLIDSTKKQFKQPKQKTASLSPYMLRPFTSKDLAPVPEGWNMGGPNFVGIGTGKGGTSWWYSLLQEHPQIVNNRLNEKELHYFDHFKHQGISKQAIEIYRSAFAAPQGSISGEWSPNYLCQPFCLEYLAKAAPEAKILVILRNPVDRTLSQINQNLSTRLQYFGLNSQQRYVFELYSTYPEAILHSYYWYGLKRLLNFFSREQILVLQYERCKSEPEKEIARTYEFLEIDDTYKPKKLAQKVNSKEYVVPSFSLEERKRLASYFLDDVKATVELFPKIDLSLWPDFAN